MQECLELNKKNKQIIFAYFLIITVILLGFFFMIVFKANNYNENFLKDFYLYFFIFQFVIYSSMISLWHIDKLKYKNLIIQILLFTISCFPHLTIILSINKLNIYYLFLPLFIQYIWGICIVSIKMLLKCRKIEEFWIYFMTKIFIFIVVIFSLIFLYYYYYYKNLVLTCCFDKRIPFVFFLNPLFTLVGVIKSQLGDVNYLGYKPVYWFCIFWIGILILINVLKKFNYQGSD